jgi:hypothetical protein
VDVVLLSGIVGVIFDEATDRNDKRFWRGSSQAVPYGGQGDRRHRPLGATEQFALEVVARGGIRPMRFFEANTQDNPACVFHLFEEIRILNRLGGCVAPAVVGLQDTTFEGIAGMMDSERRKLYLQSELSLSTLGQALVNGEDDFARHNPIRRWWGGTLLTNANLWRWDASTQALIAPR